MCIRDREAIGQRVWLGCEGEKREMAQVVGIARDSKYESLSEDAKPFFYLSRRQAAGNGYFSLIVRTAGDPYGWAKPLLSQVRGNPDFTVYEVKTLEAVSYTHLDVYKRQVHHQQDVLPALRQERRIAG